MNIDELAPAYIGEDRIKLSISPTTDPARVGRIVEVRIDYSRCLPEGAALPLDFIVQGPNQQSFISRTLRERLPAQVSFIPVEAGVHLVVLREHAHNRWLGRLRVEVVGDLVEA